MHSSKEHDEAMRDLGLRLFAALRMYAMGGGSMDKAYREMRKIEGRINPRLIELAEHASKILGEFNQDIGTKIFLDPDPRNN